MSECGVCGCALRVHRGLCVCVCVQGRMPVPVMESR